MKNMLPSIKNELNRQIKLNSKDLYRSRKTIGIHDVLKAHYILVDTFLKEGESIAIPGPRDIHLLN